MDLKKDVYTTFEAAKLCNANISSIKNWIDRGELDAFRTPGGHHRIKRESLSEFLDKHNMPNPLSARPRVLLLGSPDSALADALGRGTTTHDFDYLVSENLFEALVLLGKHAPDVVIADSEYFEPEQFIEQLQRHDFLEDTRLLVVGGEAGELTREQALSMLMDEVE